MFLTRKVPVSETSPALVLVFTATLLASVSPSIVLAGTFPPPVNEAFISENKIILVATGSKSTLCHAYAIKAVAADSRAKRNKCGFKWPLWHASQELHFKWCIQDDNYKQIANKEEKRQGQLKNCQGAGRVKPQGFNQCRLYAEEAVRAASSAYNKGCGFSGMQWQRDPRIHLEFCRQNPNPAALVLQYKSREKKLALCAARIRGKSNSRAEPVRKTRIKSAKAANFEQSKPAIDQIKLSWVFPDSNSRRLTRAELSTLPAYLLWQAGQEIKARKGLIFKDEKSANFFAAKPWYRPRRAAIKLNKIERTNMRIILSFQ